MSEALKFYLKNIAETTIHGDAREEGYYSSLKTLLEEISPAGKAYVTVLPKKTEAGNPDFRVWDGKLHITGYIEAKIPGTDLDRIEKTEQLKRYLATFPNLLLTDFFEFRLYRNGQLMQKTSIGRPFIAQRIKQIPPIENESAFEQLMQQFFAFSLPKTFTAESLAIELAKRTHFLREQVIAEELHEETLGRGEIRAFYRTFQKYLLPDLTESSFADLYSQTLTYGLFAARSRAQGEFSRTSAYRYIPSTIGILRDVFRYISLGDLSAQMEVMVDDIADVLAIADLEKILKQFDRAGKGKDPIIHFYETFLAAYDPSLREKRGVYYTPVPVVGYIVRSIHEILKSHFGLHDGLADPKVTLLDPAAGTLTFPVEAMRLAIDEYTHKYGEGNKNGFIKDQLLKNFFAFELMMAPYAIGHLKMSFLLEELGCPLTNEERFQLYLTNTLTMEEIYLSDVPGLSSLGEESQAASQVKKQNILVILGNPPYSGISANNNDWTKRLLKTEMDGAQSYYVVNGKPLGERNPKWLQDDYVKFLRFAQWKVARAGEGVVGMITNHGYLDNPTFRGMRQSLMKTFNEIYVLDLHGSALKKETAPDGSKDENVFDIRPGVAIILMIKQKEKFGCTVKQLDLFGTRESKYDWLDTHTFTTTSYTDSHAESSGFYFTKPHEQDLSTYQKWLEINKIFPKNSAGIVTSRDNFLIDFYKNDLKNRVLLLNNPIISDDSLRMAFSLNENAHWNLKQARAKIGKNVNLEEDITSINYRPFDTRSIFYNDNFIERPRRDIMCHMLRGDNKGLITVRRVPGNKEARYFFVANSIISNGVIRSDNQSIDSLFPLYLYSNNGQGNLFSGNHTPNLMPGLVEKIQLSFGCAPGPEEIFAYIYGIFYSNIYRERYVEALRTDFPRIPFTNQVKIFDFMSNLGQRLIDLHLLKSAELDPPVARYQSRVNNSTNDVIEKVEYDPSHALVWINDEKYFEGVTPAVWEYQIGGYQVLNKYLKDRKGQRMDDPVRYLHIVTALSKTIEIQQEIDRVYPEVEKDLIDFSK